jgi:DNA-directed RNA polymerase subunit E'/Rpb7
MLSQNKMYQTIYFDERVPLSPIELNRISVPDDDPKAIQTSIKNILEEKLRLKHEGFCSANGYVRKGSVKLIAKSMGVAENGRFTGNFLYDCKVSVDVYYPVANSLVDVRILKKNAMGAYAVLSAGADDVDEAMQVNIPHDLHPKSPEFEAIEQNQIVKIRILKSRFQINDRFIIAVGRLHDYEVANGIEVEDSDVSDTETDDSDVEETKPAPKPVTQTMKNVEEEAESVGEEDAEEDE